MKAFLAIAMIALGTATAASSAAPTGPAGMWHRLNPRQSQANPVPEHEQLECHQRLDGLEWSCRYFKIPEPRSSFGWNTTRGTFVGHDVTDTWACPGWFPLAVCNNVVQVVEGTFTFEPAAGPPFSSFQDLVVVRAGAGQVLYDYWVGAFACPWFRSFDEALAANPSIGNDCLVAP
jgi:hypothetical protein